MLVDDHPVVRKGLCLLIEREPDMTVCAEAEDAADALRGAIEKKPDLVIMDISLKNSNGLELLKDFRVQLPDLPVLVLSIHDEMVYAERVLRAGARGYIMKHEAMDRVLAAIRQVLRGDIYLSEKMQSRVFDLVRHPHSKANLPLTQLTDRELEVFELIGRGQGTRQIADHLNISVKTVEFHISRIKDKLGLKHHVELIQQAALWISNENRN